MGREAESAGVYLLMFRRDGSQGKHEEIYSREEENRRGPGSKLWRQTCLEWVTLRGGREGGVERGVSGGGTGGRDAAAAFHRRGESPRNCQAGSWKDSLGSSPGGHCSSHQQLGGG